MKPEAFYRRLVVPLWMKIAMPIGVSIVLFAVAIFGVHLPNVYDSLLGEKKTALKDTVQIVWSVLQYHYALELQGVMSREDAQRMVLRTIEGLHFGPQYKGYCWVTDLHPRMVMHPYMPELDGQDLREYTDLEGKHVFTEMVEKTGYTGSAFVAYHWQREDNSRVVVPKISYVKRFEPWGWIIGSGIYLQDVEQLAQQQARELMSISVAVLLCVAGLSLLPVWHGVRAARKIREREATLQGIFDQTREFIGVLEMDGKIRRINRTALEFAGVAQEDVQDRFFWETLLCQKDPGMQDAVRDAVVRARNGDMSVFETRHVGHDGREIDLDVAIMPILDETGTPMFLFASGVDVTDHKRAQTALEERVEERTRELQAALDYQKKAQHHLAQSEKMAALGGLVAGVAHEINTPLGLGVTNATYLQEQLTSMRESYQGGRFTKGEFEIFLERADEAVRSMLINLRRGAEIIRSFKQVAVDQEVEERRTFVLREYLDEVLVSLKPRYKHTGHTLEVDCPAEIVLETFPGVLMQVLSNLVLNSLLHGFEHTRNGTMRIRAAHVEDRVLIEYSDTGRGMTAEEQAKVYDPFFTTKQGQGGTGLGMHIVFNLVTQKLCGTIDLVSAPGEGVCFTLNVPVHHPGDSCPA